MILTFEFDLVRVKTDQQAKYLGQKLFRSKVVVQNIPKLTTLVSTRILL